MPRAQNRLDRSRGRLKSFAPLLACVLVACVESFEWEAPDDTEVDIQGSVDDLDDAEERCSSEVDCDELTDLGWVRVSSGYFVMGSPPGELGRRSGETQHDVALVGEYELSDCEVTQEQFEQVMGFNPSLFVGCPECPVELVSWNEAADFCNGLSDDTGLPRCYDCSGAGVSLECAPNPAFESIYHCPGYRLPTEAEWEYAARAGTTTSTYAGDLDDAACESAVVDSIAWYCGNADDLTHPVGTRAPNAWGLFDMLGNVAEWCHDWYAPYPRSPAVDPEGPESGSGRVVRGGAWLYDAQNTRAALRGSFTPANSIGILGFRVARSLD